MQTSIFTSMFLPFESTDAMLANPADSSNIFTFIAVTAQNHVVESLPLKPNMNRMAYKHIQVSFHNYEWLSHLHAASTACFSMFKIQLQRSPPTAWRMPCSFELGHWTDYSPLAELFLFTQSAISTITAQISNHEWCNSSLNNPTPANSNIPFRFMFLKQWFAFLVSREKKTNKSQGQQTRI